MPLDEKEKEALKERYKEHRQAIWSGKRSRKLNRKKEEEVKTRSSAEQPTKSGNLEDAISVEESPKLADYEEQNQMVILRRTKEKKPVNEALTEKMPPFSERTTWFTGFDTQSYSTQAVNPSSLYEPESTHKTEAKLSSPDVKTTILERSEPQSNFSSSSPNVAELSTELEVIADTTTSQENILKEKIKSQRQEIWAGTSSQKKRQPKLKKQKGTEAEENLELISEQNSQETNKGLTLSIVLIGIAAVVVAVVLGVLLGYLLA